jgi:hypothetical protein
MIISLRFNQKRLNDLHKNQEKQMEEDKVIRGFADRLGYSEVEASHYYSFRPKRRGLNTRARYIGMAELFKLSLILFLSLMPIIASAAEGKRGITELAVIPLHLGVNTVERFASDDRPAIIAMGWRENWNAHSYNFFLVLMPSAIGKADWNVVDIVPDDTHMRDFIRDYPHTEDDFVSSVRFARGKVNGVAATLLITATRQIKGMPIPDPAIVVFEVYRLEANSEIGTTRDIFKRVLKWQSDKKYSNSDLALQKELGLPVPK